MPRAKTWFARVPPGDVFHGQAEFIRRFMGPLFRDLDAGDLAGSQSAHFDRLGSEVRFRLVGDTEGFTAALVTSVENRLIQAKADGLITDSRSEEEGDWETPDPRYGTDTPGVGPAFTQFMESVSRATIAVLSEQHTNRVPEEVLWNWLHLVHNPMTGIRRDVIEVPPGTVVHTL